jgi:hypothetical protein
MPGLFQRDAQAALVFGAGARFPARFDFPTIRDVAFHKAASILVVNLTHMIVAELANFAASAALTAPATITTIAALTARPSFRSSLHELFSLFPCHAFFAGDLRKVVLVKEWVKIVA